MLVNLKVENVVLRIFKKILLFSLLPLLLVSAGCRTHKPRSVNKTSTASKPEEIEDTHFQSLRLRPERDTEELGVLIVSPDGKVRRVK